MEEGNKGSNEYAMTELISHTAYPGCLKCLLWIIERLRDIQTIFSEGEGNDPIQGEGNFLLHKT